MRGTTVEPWRVPEDLEGTQAALNGVIVIAGPENDPHLVADCRSTSLPLSEQRANAKLVQRAPEMAAALLRIESEVGDLPGHSRAATVIYGLVADVMRGLRMRRRDEDSDD